jgi:hypothetical protein
MNTLVVPVVPELQALARRLLIAPEEILAMAPDRPSYRGIRQDKTLALTQLRRSGIFALAPFKTRDNVSLLARYLDDPASPVREAALEVMTFWDETEPRTIAR